MVYRPQGDRHLLVEYGPIVLDLALRLRIHALLTEVEQLFQQANVPQNGALRALQVLKTAAQQSIDTGLPIILW